MTAIEWNGHIIIADGHNIVYILSKTVILSRLLCQQRSLPIQQAHKTYIYLSVIRKRKGQQNPNFHTSNSISILDTFTPTLFASDIAPNQTL